MAKVSLTNTYKKYSKYKDSGIDWVGMVPTDWDSTRAKNIFKKNNRPVRESDEVVTAFRDGTVTLRKNRREDGFTFAQQEIGYQGVREGDLVIHGMDAFAGAIGVSDSDGKSSPVYAVCTPRVDADPKFHMYLLRHMSRSGYLNAIARGIRERSTEFKWPQYGNLFVINPPKEEQEKIAKFLDEQTARIDETITKKQRLIELLKEKRTATINHAVTKGIDCNVELVDSGIDWIGKIPKDWELQKLKNFVKTIQAGVWGDDAQGDENDIKCLRVADFDYENLSYTEVTTVRNNQKLQKNKILIEGDILVEKSGGGEKTPVGRSILFQGGEKMTCANFIDIVRLDNQRVESSFAVLVLSALYATRRNTLYIKQNTGIQNLALKHYVGEQIPVPPIEAQRAISKFLFDKIEEHRKVEKSIMNSVSQLQELKSSLISHAVTGKIKV